MNNRHEPSALGGLPIAALQSLTTKSADHEPVQEQIRRYFGDAMSNRDVLDEIRARSSLHMNGFLKLLLLPASRVRPFAVRLHLWDGENFPDESDPHNHRWHYRSLLLEGSLVETEYAVTDQADDTAIEAVTLDYESDNRSGSVKIGRLGEEYITRTAQLHLTAGALVDAQPNRVHSICPSSPVAVTLVVTSAGRRASSTIYRVAAERTAVHERNLYTRPARHQVQDGLERAAHAIANLIQ